MVFRALRRKPSLPPELRELGETLKQGKKALASAEKEHAGRVKAARKKLREAEREHERAVRAAQAELERRKKERAQRIEQAKKRYDSIRATLAPMEIARFGKSVLYEDRVVTKQGEALLQRGVTALADTAAKIAIARPGAVARLAASGTVNGRAFRSAQGYDARRFYLLIEAPELVALLSCRAGDEQAAKDFAARVNVAALNARRIEREREETLGDAQHELDAAEAHQDAVVAADEELACATADTGAIDLARSQLEEAEADTGAVEAQRERVAALDAEYGKAYAVEEERLAEERRLEDERRAEEKRLEQERKAEEKQRAAEAKAAAASAKADGEASDGDADATSDVAREDGESEPDVADDPAEAAVEPDASAEDVDLDDAAESAEPEAVEEPSRETVVIMETVETASDGAVGEAGASDGDVEAELAGPEVVVAGESRAAERPSEQA